MRYPDDFINKIICNDCLKIMPMIPDKSIDLILADPPYNVGQKFANDNISKKKYLRFMESWIKEAYRILKDNGSFYMFHYFLGMWDIKPILNKLDWKFLNLIIWAYPNLMPSNKALKYRWPLSYQPIFYYGKNLSRDLCGKLYKFAKEEERKDVWLKTATQSNFKKEFRWHPSCKPIAVVKKIVLASSEKNEIILDPFIGSGTTAIACKELNRKYIGIEISKEYCNIAIKRIKNAMNSLF